jgi:hypothetical protein
VREVTSQPASATTPMKVSKLWTDLSAGLFQGLDASALETFRAPGGLNRRLAAWDPAEQSLRYFKFLLQHVAQGKAAAFFDRYRRLGDVSIGRPVSVTVEGCAINVDHLFAVEEVMFVEAALPPERLRTIVEIGAGFGRTAQAFLCLQDQLQSYTILDLPEVLRLSELYLRRVLPPALFAKLRFVDALASRVEIAADLVLNIDSFQEMPRETVQQYLRAPVGQARAFYTKNPIGKYEPASVGIEVRDRATLAEVFSLGLCTDVIDIFDTQALAAARTRYLAAYSPGSTWSVTAEAPMDMFPYLHHALYERAR